MQNTLFVNQIQTQNLANWMYINEHIPFEETRVTAWPVPADMHCQTLNLEIVNGDNGELSSCVMENINEKIRDP